MKVALRPAQPSQAPLFSRLVHHSFVTLAAGAWEADAVAQFLKDSQPQALSASIASSFLAVGAWHEDATVGFALMPRASLLGMMFVSPACVGQGIGRLLWEYARSEVETRAPEVKTVELNATPYALAAYRALGFHPISHEFRFKGCVATRMACWLTARTMPQNVDPDRSEAGG
jgi:GNAT superfamily N-acetyltransferase